MSKKCANTKSSAISRGPSISSNSDYHTLGSDWTCSEDEWYPPPRSKSEEDIEFSIDSSPTPYVTMSRGQSSRTRVPDRGSSPSTPSRPRLQTDSPSTLGKRSQHFDPPTRFTDPRSPMPSYRDLDEPISISQASTPISASKVSNIRAWNEGMSGFFSSSSKKSATASRAPRPVPERTIVITDSEPETDSDAGLTDTESDVSQPSPLKARRVFSSQTTIPSNSTSRTSLGSQFSQGNGKSRGTNSGNSSNGGSPTRSPVTTSQPSPPRAIRKRDSPLPIRGKPVPSTSPAARSPKPTSPVIQRVEVSTQPLPPVTPRSVSSVSTPKRSASVPGPVTTPTPSTRVLSSFNSATPRAPGTPRRVPRGPDDPAAVDDFLQRGELCKGLEHHIIAHHKEVQAKFDELQIEWGVQYQLARGESVGLWTWDKIGRSLDKLKGTNEEVGPKILGIMLPDKATNSTDSKVWTEFDREQAAIMENKGRGLGLMGEWMTVPNWYGGRIQQLARLTKKDGDKGLKLTLEPLEKRRSHRLARFLGSRRVLQIRVPEKLAQEFQNEIREFFARRFILLGRTFVPFHVKDGSVYMVEIDLDFERTAQDWCGDQFRLGFLEFMEWHNPMSLNYKQAISKFVTRYALILSNTVPVIEFEAKNMIFIKDIDSSDTPLDGKAATEKIMTDGCGFINLAALAMITRMMGYESAPTALQGRIDGSKGLWVRHPTDKSDEPKIWIRDSQNKIKNPRLDRAHRILELVGPSKASTSVALSLQSILNLHHNNVPSETIIELFRQGLKDEVTPLLEWDSLPLLYHAVNAAGGVSGSRLARISGGHGRALGVQKAQWKPDEVEENQDDDEQQLDDATYTGRNPYSGAPASIHESLIEMIQAGFTPGESHQVQTKLKQVIKTVVESAVEKYRIPLNGSIAAWLIPDPLARNPAPEDWKPGQVKRDDLGLLKEGQIFFKSSQPLKDENEMAYHVITGDVVIGRYPMRLPSDLQKVTAVDIPEYALYTDVVIVPVNGETSLPSLLSGGDMDGDIVNIFRDPELVRHFTNKPLTQAPADLMEANFQKEVVSVLSFCSRAASMQSAFAQQWYHEFILKDVVTTQKGTYSGFHDAAVAKLGYDHPDTVRLAYVFNALLDASKTGLRLKDGISDQDKKKWGSKPAPFGILADLKAEGTKILGEFMVLFNEIASKASGGIDVSAFKDKDLTKPYQSAVDYAVGLESKGIEGEPEDEKQKRILLGRLLHDQLREIAKHVDAAQDEFKSRFGRKMIQEEKESQFGYGQSPSKAKAKPSYGSSKSDQADEMYKAAKMFADPVPGAYIYQANIEEMKASYAVCSQFNSKSQFPWSVAFRGLCTIKAKAVGIAPVVREIDECKAVSSSVAKVLAKTNTVTF